MGVASVVVVVTSKSLSKYGKRDREKGGGIKRTTIVRQTSS